MIKYAVIDIGSNSQNEPSDHRQRGYTIDRLYKKPLRLLQPGGAKIHATEIEQLLSIMLYFQQEIQIYKCAYKAMATSALRDAVNQLDVIKQIKKHTGLQIEVIGGDQEAFLVRQAHQYLFDMQMGRHIIFDIGGGSMECIEVKEGTSISQNSLTLGALRIKKMFPGETCKRKVIEEVRVTIQQQLKMQKIPQSFGKARIYISGGNPSAVSKMSLLHHQLHYQDLHKQDIYLQELYQTMLDIRKYSPEKISKRYAIKPHRSDLAVPTMVLICAILDYVEADYYTLARTGIREGEIITKMKAISKP
ncbi:MAG: hypothetical protein R3A45_09080 [Bdellovibrionota bacterium]